MLYMTIYINFVMQSLFFPFCIKYTRLWTHQAETIHIKTDFDFNMSERINIAG